jgi:hypothetical protein
LLACFGGLKQTKCRRAAAHSLVKGFGTSFAPCPAQDFATVRSDQMQKRVIKPAEVVDYARGWLELDGLADVEVTSEDPDAPIERALLEWRSGGWRASEPGEQTLRLLFHQPQRLRRIRLGFVEPADERTQEFVLRWSASDDNSFQEIVRQRWNFSPAGSTEEIEDFHVQLDAVSILELVITPDVRGGDARAKLAAMRLA